MKRDLGMRNLIWQYWDGAVPPAARYSSQLMKEYATRIGAEYLFEDNPKHIKNRGRYSPHLGQLKVIDDPKFQEYDNVLFLDSDIFPVEGLDRNIFEGFNADIGICRESWQTVNKPRNKKAEDSNWATRIEKIYGGKLPRDSKGNLIIYNSGCVMYSGKGIQNIRKNFIPLDDYMKSVRDLSVFATTDQLYLHANLQRVNWVELDEGWNSYVHYLPNTTGGINRPINDTRTSTTKFVHIQLRGADHFNNETLHRITNRPVKEWNI